ncbi:DUF4870 domain-containing protein [Botrimarina sp.]|uniref:DUF4870 domain-containing protein n=1 Tax=Botrimarina sp. TaxID=2795802 RepID=UPI0032EB488F
MEEPAYDTPPPADRTMLALMHLSQFCGYIAPLAGFVAPIIFWQVMKDESPEYDAHGRAASNWSLSQLIYWALGIAMCVTVILLPIGIPFLSVLGALGVIFPIVGAVKASKGQLWKYPITIPFF